MRIPPGAHTYCPPTATVQAGRKMGEPVYHTVRTKGAAGWLLMYTLKGGGLYRLGRQVEFRSQSHDITLLRPGVAHAYQAGAQGWHLLHAHFRPRTEWLEWLRWHEAVPGLMLLRVEDPAMREKIREGLEDVVAQSQAAGRRAEEFAMNALERVLLWCDAVNAQCTAEKIDPRVRRASEHLSRKLTEPFHQIDLTGITGLSGSRLRHLFREQVGLAPREYHEHQKMQRARHLLSFSQQTVGEIAGELGFENPFYFTLRFKKKSGCSPREFRRRMAR